MPVTTERLLTITAAGEFFRDIARGLLEQIAEAAKDGQSAEAVQAALDATQFLRPIEYAEALAILALERKHLEKAARYNAYMREYQRQKRDREKPERIKRPQGPTVGQHASRDIARLGPTNLTPVERRATHYDLPPTDRDLLDATYTPEQIAALLQPEPLTIGPEASPQQPTEGQTVDFGFTPPTPSGVSTYHAPGEKPEFTPEDQT